MTIFSDCLGFVLQEEGGNSDDPRDPGGRTSRGMTQRTYDAWRHKQNLPTQDVFAMNDAECAAIYETEYWAPSHCAVLQAPVALYVFDMAVNMGVDRSLRLLQAASGVVVDGQFGPETLQAATADAGLIGALHTIRENFYRSLSNFDRFGKGWLARNDACRDLALSWLTKGKDDGDPAG